MRRPATVSPWLLVVMFSVSLAPMVNGQEAAPQTQEVALGGLSDLASREVFTLVVQHAVMKLNYERVDTPPPQMADGLARRLALQRQVDGALHELAVGLDSLATQAPQLHLWGAVTKGEATEPNPDVDALVAAAQQAVEAAKKAPRKFSVRELENEIYQLSCTDVKSCIDTLKALSYNTDAPKGQVSLDQLPATFALPYAGSKSIVQAVDASKRSLADDTLSGPENRLMIMYHASQSEEVAALKELLDNTIDVPARQVRIDGMVIELKETDSKELGVDWEWFGDENWRMTFLEDGGKSPYIFTYDPAYVPAAELASKVRATVRMLIEEGKGEVLSSPSVLVLNDRNALIEVTQDVPIFKTVLTESTTKVDITYKTAGIILNIKPRISQDGSTVAMQVLVEVSDAPEEDFIRVQDQAVAPIINYRKVQTVARIRDNVPFIIGGLIRDETGHEGDRVPVISKVPILGNFFQSKTDRREKREVIIVLTPHVLETRGAQRSVLPKDSPRFNFLNNRLFRNAYRIRAEDLFDLRFLEMDETVRDAIADARFLVRRESKYAREWPFRQLAERELPGEDAVALRMLYEIVKKLGLHERVDPDNLILFADDPGKPAGFTVRFLTVDSRPGKVGLLEGASPDGDVGTYFDAPYPRKVVVLHYRMEPCGGLESALSTPVAAVEEVLIRDEDEEKALEAAALEANRLDGPREYKELMVPLIGLSDLERLRAAVALRELAKVNESRDLMRLSNLQRGRQIAIPELNGPEGRTYLVDHEVAGIFFKSDHYYVDLADNLHAAYQILDEAMAREGYR